MTSARAYMVRRAVLSVSMAVLVFATAPRPAAAMADRNASLTYLADATDDIAAGKIDDAIVQLKNALQADPSNIEARLQLADLYIQTRNGISAEKEIKAAIERGKLQGTAQDKLARAYMLQGKYEDIVSDMPPESADPSVRPALLCARGEAYYNLGNPKSAIAEYEAAEQLAPKDPQPKIGLARAYIRTRDLAAAEAAADAALAASPQSPDAMIAKGQVLQAKGDLSGAVAELSAGLAVRPNDIVGLVSRAAVLVDLKQYDKALPDAMAARQADPILPSAAYLNALILARMGNYAKARDVLQQADGLLRGYGPAIYLSGAVAYAQGSYEQATSDLKSFLTIEPGSVSAARLLGAALLHIGDADSAVSVLEPIVSKASGDPRIHAILGSAYMAKKQYPAALAQFERAVEIAPDDGSLRTKLLVAKMSVGDDVGALQVLGAALASDPEAVSAATTLAESELRNRRFDNVVEVGRQLKNKYPADPIGEAIIAAGLWGKGDLAGARDHYGRALAVRPHYEPAILALARIDVKQHDPASARKRYQDLLSRSPKNVAALMGLYWLAYQEHDDKAAESWLTRAIETDPTAPEPQLELTRRHAVAGDMDRALLEANELVRNHPQDAKALQILAEIQLKVRDPIAAITTASQLVDVAPSLPRGYVLKARAQQAVSNAGDARTTLQHGLEVSPYDASLTAELVRLEMRQGNYDAALGDATDLRRHKPDSVADQLIGDVYMTMGQFGPAIDAFKSAYNREPSAERALRLDTAYKKNGDPAAGIAALRAWIAANPNDFDTRVVLASAQLDQGQTAVAAKSFEALYAEKPTDPIVLNNLAWIYHEQGDARALEMARKAYAADKNSAQVLDTLGWITLSSESPTSGVDYLRMAVAMAPRAPQIRYHLAVALTRTGHEDEARTVLTGLLADNSDFAEAADARKLLSKLGG